MGNTMSTPLVTISIIHFSLKDGFTVKHHLKPFFESIFAQSYKNVEIYCIDNASTDEECKDFLRKLPGVEVIWLPENLGTCAHNAVLERAKGKYLWCVTMDTRYAPDFLEQLVMQAEKLPQGGAFGGALFYLEGEQKTQKIDSLGTGINKWHSFWERHHHEVYDATKFPSVEEVFGISGATVLYRMDALRDIALTDGTVWDQRFFMYYEDVDVCYRMQWRAWRAFTVHAAQGWHVRTAKEVESRGGRITRILRSRKGKSIFYRSLPTRNKLWLLWRNMRRSLSLSVYIATALELCGRLGYIIVFERELLPAVRESWQQRKLLEILPAKPDEEQAAKHIESLMR